MIKLKRFFLPIGIILNLFLYTPTGKTFFQFQPYIGYGVGTLSYGNKTVFDGGIQGYLLGIKGGIEINNYFSFLADYSRSGPIDYFSQSTNTEFNTSKALFNIFSGGFGLQWSAKSFYLWVGYYPYDRFIEYTRDFRFKGNLQRIGMGFPLSPTFKVHFYYDVHAFKGDSLTNADLNLICTNSLTNCIDSGNLNEVSFVVSSKL